MYIMLIYKKKKNRHENCVCSVCTFPAFRPNALLIFFLNSDFSEYELKIQTKTILPKRKSREKKNTAQQTHIYFIPYIYKQYTIPKFTIDSTQKETDKIRSVHEIRAKYA